VTTLTVPNHHFLDNHAMTLFRNRYRVESARLADWDDSRCGWYFVTVCTKDKKCLLGQVSDGRVVLSQGGLIAEDELRSIPGHYSNVMIDRFVIMPNHVHTIVVIEGEHQYSPDETRQAASLRPAHKPLAKSLAAIVGSYKSGVSRRCRLCGIADFAWQSRFHDHILRSNAAVNAVRDYIDKNPENWHEDTDYPAA
jgi:putative transposase